MKLYKVEITRYPFAATDTFDGIYEELRTDWQPDGWLTDPDQRAWWIERHGDTRFFWPSTKRLYQSRSGAENRAALIRSYGAEVEVIESDEIVWLTEDIRRQRRIDELRTELARLEGRPALEVVA